MAGIKMGMKKGRDDKGKCAKGSDAQEEDDDLDYSELRKPIQTSVTGFAKARQVFDTATEEIKDLITNECDILYECRVCRSMFRSLANFICHKRIYCIDSYSPTSHGHFVSSTSLATELLKIQKAEELYVESMKKKTTIDDEDEDYRIPMSKDITTLIEKITKQKGVHRSLQDWQDLQMSFQKIPSSSAAVFQNSRLMQEDNTDTMCSQILELDEIQSTNKAVLQSDGKFSVESSKGDADVVKAEPVIQISDEDDSDHLVCKICGRQFSTSKTLRFHLRHVHVEARLVFPCPECLDTFSTSWSVYRHLFKVHRKTAAQIRRIRESIQSKAFRMNNPPASYERERRRAQLAAKTAPREDTATPHEPQTWLEGSGGRCLACSRVFSRRAGLQAHAASCMAWRRRPHAPPASTAPPAPAAPTGPTPIQIQIRRDYPKPAATAAATASQGPQDKTTSKEREVDNGDENSNDRDSSSEDSPQKNETTNQAETKTGDTKLTPGEKLHNALKAIKLKKINLPKSNDINFDSLICHQCEVKNEMCEHLAVEPKYVRYGCKLCNYKNYYYKKVIEHLRVVHKMKGDGDFYATTINIITNSELHSITEEAEGTEISPESRRPSRCSSDSSRLSDDNSNSSTKTVNRRKRKVPTIYQPLKKKKSNDGELTGDIKDGEMTMNKVIDAIFGDNDNKTGEDNSSELDDIEERPAEKPRKLTEKTEVVPHTMPRRRPVRNRAKPKHADFEYDLSNLLKMDAMGYKESPPPSTTVQKPQNIVVVKKKPQADSQSNSSNDSLRDYSGALFLMSRKSLDTSSVHLRLRDMSMVNTKKQTPCNSFLRPFQPPKGKSDKSPPKKLSDGFEFIKLKPQINQYSAKTERKNTEPDKLSITKSNLSLDTLRELSKSRDTLDQTTSIIKVRRQSLDLIKTDIAKTAMKNKIIVIKPVSKNKDGTAAVMSSLNLPRIKLKEATTENKSLLIKVPPVATVSQPDLIPTNGEVISKTAAKEVKEGIEDYQIQTESPPEEELQDVEEYLEESYLQEAPAPSEDMENDSSDT